jgi:cytochrome P450
MDAHLLHLGLAICMAVIVYSAYRCLRYFTSELPSLGSGLKRLPGPMSTLPYLGRIHDVDRMQAWNAMKKFSDEYDGLFACTLGGETHIWIAREDLAQDLLVNNAAISSSRADLGSYPGVTQGHKYLPLLGYTETFHRQRRFAHSVMTRCAINKFYGHINLETRRLMHDLVTAPNNWWHAMHLHCARVSSKLAYGFTDQAHDHVINADKFLGQIGPSGPVANLMPFLAHFPEWLVPGKSNVRKRQEEEAKLWNDLFQKAKGNPSRDGRTDTYTNASVAARVSGESKRMLFEKEEEAQCAVGMLCTVGVFTVAGPATLFVMAMILHPEWQQKVREQIDEVVQDRMLDLSDSPRLPVLRAAIKECLRWKSTVPLGKQYPLPMLRIRKLTKLRCAPSIIQRLHLQWVSFPQGGSGACLRHCNVTRP